jgi:hypothetical protein
MAPTKTIEPPVYVYDPEILDHVLKRLSALALEIQEVSSDLASHHQKHSAVHVHDTGARIVPAATDPATMGRVHALQIAIGEFTNAVLRR